MTRRTATGLRTVPTTREPGSSPTQPHDGRAQGFSDPVADPAESSRPAPAVWTVADLAGVLQATTSWIYDQVEAGCIPHLRLGRQLRFRPEDITAWLADQHQPARPPDPVLSARPKPRRRRTTPAWPAASPDHLTAGPPQPELIYPPIRASINS